MNVVMRARDERGELLEGPIRWPFDVAPVAGNEFHLRLGGHDGGGDEDWHGTIDRVVYDVTEAEGRIVLVIDALRRGIPGVPKQP